MRRALVGLSAIARPCKQSAGQKVKRRSFSSNGFHKIPELKTSRDHIAYFLSRQDSLLPSDVCAILEGLWNILQLEHAEADVKAAKKKLFNNRDYMAIMKDVVFKLDRFKAEDLPRLIAVLYSMRWNDKQLFKIAEPMVIKEMPSMGPTGLLQVTNSFVGVGCGSRLLFDQLVWCCFQTAHQFSSEEVALLSQCFSKAPHKPKAFLIGFASVVSKHMSHFSEKDLEAIMMAYSSWPLEVPRDFVEELLHNVKPQTLSAGSLVLILRFLALWCTRARAARENHSWKAPISELFVISTERLTHASMTVEEAAQTMWSYCKVKPKGRVPRKLFESLYDRILGDMDQLAVPSLASCLLNAGKAVCGEIRFWDESNARKDSAPFADRRMLLESETRVVRAIGEMDSRDLTAVVKAYSLSQCGSQEIFSLFLQQTTERCRQLAAEELSSILWSYATVRLGPSFAREAQIDVLDRLGQFSVSGLCETIWAYCALRHRDAHFFKTLLGMLTPSAVAGNKRCALLCPALLEIRTYFPDMDPEGLERYLSYVQEAFSRLQVQSAAPEATRQRLQECLLRSNLQSLSLTNVDGYVVDVMIPSSLQKPVAVQYHSAPRTLHFATAEPLGQTMMKQPLGTLQASFAYHKKHREE